MMEILIALTISLLFAIGVFQLLRRNLIRSAMGLAIITNAINLFLLAAGAYRGEAPAYVNLAGQRSDALPQALILTAIVIGLGAFAVVLAMVYVLSLRYKTSDSDEVKGLRH